MKKIVLLLCGLPGAGKSSFAARFQEYAMNNTELFASVRVVSFDEFEQPKDTWDSKSYQLCRNSSLSSVKDALELLDDCQDPGCFSSIIVDDNMALHSMRRQIYAIAKLHRAQTVVVWIKVDPAVAYSRNQSRADSKVADESWMRMKDAFEAPNTKYIAERHCVIVDGSSDESLDQGIRSVAQTCQELLHNYIGVVEVMEASSECIETDNEEGGIGPLVAQIENELRNCVGCIMRQVSVSLNQRLSCGNESRRRLLSNVSAVLNTCKKACVNCSRVLLRQHNSSISSDATREVTGIEVEKDVIIDEFISTVLTELLAVEGQNADLISAEVLASIVESTKEKHPELV